MGNTKKLKRLIYISISILFIWIIIFISRGPCISNALKRIILPELENMSGRKVIAQKIYLNLFPLFIAAKGLKVFDDEGRKVLTADRVKGYVGLSGILRRELIVKRIVIKGPEIWMDREQLNNIIDKVREYLIKKDKKKITVKVDVIEVRDGGFSFYDPDYDAVITGRGLDSEILPGDMPRLKAYIKELISDVEGFPELRCEINSMLFFKKDGVDIKNITLKSYGSEMQTTGFYSAEGKGSLITDMNLLAESVKKILGLKQRGEGKVSVKGNIKFQVPGAKFQISSFGNISVYLRIKGSLYLQTLMELLKVKKRIEGWMDIDGKMSGTISNITGSGDARLRNGNLFGVDIDDLRCRVEYSNGIMSFNNGKALLYNGRADADASLKVPNVEHYSLKVNFMNVDSSGALKLIGWQPEIPEGKVRGELYTSGSKFNPSVWFDYETPPVYPPLIRGELKGGVRPTEVDVLGKIKKIRGSFKVQDGILSLADTEIKTERSSLDINGIIDIPVSTLNLNGRLNSTDITDLTSPYLSRLSGSGDFIGTVTGKFDDPLISGTLRITSAAFDNYKLENISGELSYRKNLLDVKDLSAGLKDERHTIRGNIKFDSAKELFDLKHPEFAMNVSLRGADFEKLVGIFYKKLPLKGRLDSDFNITGKGPNPQYSGSATIADAEAYKFSLDSVSSDFSYNYKDFIIRKAVLKKGNSAVVIEGRILDRDRFSFSVSADRLFLKDTGLKGIPDDAVLNVIAKGAGTFDNPDITLNGRLSGGTFRGKPLGDGKIEASVKNKDILFNALLFDEKMRLKGRAHLDNTLPWTAELDLSSGRYDFLIPVLLKDVPEDLLLNIKGHADLSGDRRHLSASAVINQMNVTIFGNSFANDSDIKFTLHNRKMTFSAFTIQSGNASFNLRGDMEIGKEYNMVLEGSSALSPLRLLSKRIGLIRGDTDFTLTITGKWENPQISGSLSVTNASFGLKDIHQRISSINGYFYFEEDRIVIQKLTGKLGGGDIDVSGLIYLIGFRIKRFYLDAKLNNIAASISKEFTVNFDGDILYKGTLESQNVVGEIKVNRARYRERVEWKSWLLKTRPKEKPKAEPTGIEKAILNIKIYGTENIIVDNNIARAPLKVDVVLRGTIGHPLLFGRVESREGKVYFRNNEFRILNASADFADPNRINPLMEIVAQTIVKGYNIKLSLEGQFEHFNLSFISDPPLEETDVLSLLTVGQIGRELKGLEGGIGAGEAAAFLTGKVQDVFEDRLRNITGLDRVQVDPYVSKATGMIGPRVTVSKRLLSDRLFVTYISSVGSTEEQVLRLEYILGRNVSLVGIRDEKGSVGGDIKFRFEFR